MAGLQTKDARQQDSGKAQEKKRRLEPAPLPVKAPADESVPFTGLLGVSAMEIPLENHAAFIGDPRFSRSANNTQKARIAMQLQQTYGNQYVQRLLDSTKVQTKLIVNSPDDRYEKEADRVAAAVTGAPASSVQRQVPDEEEAAEPQGQEEERIQNKLTNDIQVQRQAEEPEGKEEPTQTEKTGGHTPLISSGLQSRIDSLKGGGQPLPTPTRNYFELRFGSNFNNVRIYNGSRAADIAKSINAKAFTTGKDIVFGAGQYSPETSGGQHLLAHDLTHVVQQRGSHLVQRRAEIPPTGPTPAVKRGPVQGVVRAFFIPDPTVLPSSKAYRAAIKLGDHFRNILGVPAVKVSKLAQVFRLLVQEYRKSPVRIRRLIIIGHGNRKGAFSDGGSPVLPANYVNDYNAQTVRSKIMSPGAVIEFWACLIGLAPKALKGWAGVFGGEVRAPKGYMGTRTFFFKRQPLTEQEFTRKYKSNMLMKDMVNIKVEHTSEVYDIEEPTGPLPTNVGRKLLNALRWWRTNFSAKKGQLIRKFQNELLARYAMLTKTREIVETKPRRNRTQIIQYMRNLFNRSKGKISYVYISSVKGRIRPIGRSRKSPWLKMWRRPFSE